MIYEHHDQLFILFSTLVNPPHIQTKSDVGREIIQTTTQNN